MTGTTTPTTTTTQNPLAVLLRRRGALAALVVAAGVLAVTLAQTVAGSIVTTATSFGFGGGPDFILGIWSLTVVGAALVEVPFAIGVFLSLWLLAPIAAELRIGHVITRSLLAAGAGAVLVLVFQVIAALVRGVAMSRGIFGGSFPFSDLASSNVGQQMLSSVQTAAAQFIALAPVVVLVGIFLWLWLERHPVKHSVSGMIDEV